MVPISTWNVISVQDWDKLVENTYGKPYSLQQQDGCKGRGIEWIDVPDQYYDHDEEESYMNDSIPELINGNEYGVKFKTWLARDPKAPLNPTDKQLSDCNYYWADKDNAKAKEDYKNSLSHINLFWERNFYPNVGALCDDLFEKGLIEKGEYAINIDW